MALAANGYAQAVRYIADLYGVDYLAAPWAWPQRRLHGPADPVAQPDSGEKDGKVDVLVNVACRVAKRQRHCLRPPPSASRPWGVQAGVAVEVEHKQGNWMARDPKGAWLATLLNTFGDTTGCPRSLCPPPGTAPPPN